MLTVGVDGRAGEHHRSSRRSRSRTSASSRPLRPCSLSRRLDGRRPAAPPGHRRRARARRDGDGAARALRARRRCATTPTTTRRCRSATAQTISQPYMVAAHLRAARPARATSACSTSARAPATRRRCWPSWRDEVVPSSACPSSPSAPAPHSPTPGYERVRRAGRRRDARRPRAGAVRRDRRRRRRAANCRTRSTTSSRPAGGSSSPSAAGARSASSSSSGARRARRCSALCPAGSCRSSARRGSRSSRCCGVRLDGQDVTGWRGCGERSCCGGRCASTASELGRAVDLILDESARRVLGFDVLCGDGEHRFLPLAAAEAAPGQIAVRSALTLLDPDELAFYRAPRHDAHRTTCRRDRDDRAARRGRDRRRRARDRATTTRLVG